MHHWNVLKTLILPHQIISYLRHEVNRNLNRAGSAHQPKRDEEEEGGEGSSGEEEEKRGKGGKRGKEEKRRKEEKRGKEEKKDDSDEEPEVTLLFGPL